MIDRENERRLVESFLDATGLGVRALLIEGEPGVGKSTLWQSGLERARNRGYSVLTARPTQAESALPFATLADLFGVLVGDDSRRLPPPQQAALDVALMRAPPPPEPMQPLALSLAVLELLHTAATTRPLVIAVDDLPWIDPSSGAALRFALRRVEEGQVAVLATRRVAGPAPMPPLLADLPVDRVTTISLEGLGREAVDELLESSLGLQLAPSELYRIHRLSAGNPLHALELGRAITAREGGPIGNAGSLPASLAALVRDRLAKLSPDGRDVVVHAEALAQPTSVLLRAALGDEAADRGLVEAYEADILVDVGDRLRFTHPLLGSEAYGQLRDGERRDLHARLGAVVDDPDERAWHLAAAAADADPAVATELDAAVSRALNRGAPDIAADLAEVAARLTPAADRGRAHRWAEAGRHRLMVGDIGKARIVVEQALDEPSALGGPGRAELLHRLAMVRQLAGEFEAARDLGREALEHVGDEVALAVEIELLLAGVAFVTGSDWAEGARHAYGAMRMAEEQGGEPRLVAMSLGKYAAWRYATGEGCDSDFEQRIRALEPLTRRFRTLDLPEFDLSVIEMAEGLTASVGARYARLLERAEREGDYSSLPFLLANAAFLDLVEGRTADARDRIGRALRLAWTTSQDTALVHVLTYDARIEARLGSADRALAAAQEAFRLIDSSGWRVAEWWLRTDLAVLELGRGDPDAALRHVEAAVTGRFDASGRSRWAVPAAADALITLGRHDDARLALDRLAEHDSMLPRRVRADALRVRARLLAATGELAAADAAIGEAEAMHRQMGDRWEVARTLLVAGEVHRRARRRAMARAALREAMETFTFLGARLWAQQAREQLGRVGIGRRSAELTSAQRRVAALAATGLTNRQVGDRLSMSAHTVEAHLSEVYRSLGIRSRRDLTPALAGTGAVRDTAAQSRDTASS